MRTNFLSFVLGTGNRKAVVKALLAYPKRQWSCTALEDVTKLPHATVFRTIKRLELFGLLRSSKINRKDIVYELVRLSPLIKDLERLIHAEQNAAKIIAKEFTRKIASKGTKAIILYGSAVRGTMKPGSDIDILVVVDARQGEREQRIHDVAASLSLKYNWVISAVVMDEREVRREKNGPFFQSIKKSMMILYGKAPL